jgi:hypothetical protein
MFSTATVGPPELFSAFVNWFTHHRENTGHPEIHRMA